VPHLDEKEKADRAFGQYQVDGGYRTKINRLREIDPEDPVADHLEGMLVHLSEREVADEARIETVTADMKKHQIKVEQTHLDNYEKSYNEMKAQRISELTKWGHMDAEAAEQQFQQIEHASLSVSLKRHHGIAAWKNPGLVPGSGYCQT